MYNKTNLQRHFQTAHLVVDMQNMWMRGLSAADRATLPSHLESFLNDTHETIPALYVSTQDEQMYWADDTTPYDIAIEGAPSGISHVWKTRSSGFNDSGEHSQLHNVLKSMGVNSIIVSGVNLRRCVWETAVDAARLGYDVTILEDACRDAEWCQRSTDFPAVTADLCAQNGIKLGYTDQYRNTPQAFAPQHI